jgi:hypothetical protein
VTSVRTVGRACRGLWDVHTASCHRRNPCGACSIVRGALPRAQVRTRRQEVLQPDRHGGSDRSNDRCATRPAMSGSRILAGGALARLGCTRIGSPGIFGERNPIALFKGVKPQVARERKVGGYRASFPARHVHLPSPSGRDHRSRYPYRRRECGELDKHRPPGDRATQGPARGSSIESRRPTIGAFRRSSSPSSVEGEPVYRGSPSPIRPARPFPSAAAGALRRACADRSARRAKYALRACPARRARSAGDNTPSGSTWRSKRSSMARRAGAVRALGSAVLAHDSCAASRAIRERSAVMETRLHVLLQSVSCDATSLTKWRIPVNPPLQHAAPRALPALTGEQQVLQSFCSSSPRTAASKELYGGCPDSSVPSLLEDY